jgi:hypothetical protein
MFALFLVFLLWCVYVCVCVLLWCVCVCVCFVVCVCMYVCVSNVGCSGCPSISKIVALQCNAMPMPSDAMQCHAMPSDAMPMPMQPHPRPLPDWREYNIKEQDERRKEKERQPKERIPETRIPSHAIPYTWFVIKSVSQSSVVVVVVVGQHRMPNLVRFSNPSIHPASQPATQGRKSIEWS